ncbi:MAG: hypothetical protein QGF67_13875 [Lentisphaeria bacterium]|jgi:hypothetical protein|nr:hypothetical protein [Lentisphaeria bacterium]MDP7742526.1 hypothetical protein [Lentisphaeria bacterium]
MSAPFSITLEHPSFPGNVFSYQCFESIHRDDAPPVYDLMPEEEGDSGWKTDVPGLCGSCSVVTKDDCPLLVELSIREAANGFRVSADITNHGGSPTPTLYGSPCLRYIDAPMFAGPGQLERKFIHVDSTRRYLAATRRDPGKNTLLQQFYLMPGRKVDHHWGVSPELVSSGIIGVESLDGEFVLATNWDTVHSVCDNSRDAYCCIHSMPFIGVIAPGESTTLDGVIYIGNLAGMAAGLESLQAGQP